MRFVSLPMGAALAAHALAWIAAVFFVFAPTYSGESSTSVTRGAESVTETVRYTQTMLEANGPGVIVLLLVPVLLTGIALLAIRSANDGQMTRPVFIWGPAAVLLILCVLGFWLSASSTCPQPSPSSPRPSPTAEPNTTPTPDRTTDRMRISSR